MSDQQCVTLAPAELLRGPQAALECDFCRKTLTPGDRYFHLTLGMDDSPAIAGQPYETESTVEQTSELNACASCEPQVSAEFERLLETFWKMRAPDTVSAVTETPS